MRALSIFRLRLRSLFAHKRVEQELDEELRYHLERQIDEGIAAGMTPSDARYAALQSIKDLEQRKEECRDIRRLTLIENAFQDLRYAIRQLRKSPAFGCTAIFVLALGVSAVLAIFGFVNAALIKPLPYRDQSRLVAVFETSRDYPRGIISYFEFLEWKRLNRVFRSIDACAMNGGFTLSTSTGAQQVAGARVSAGFFHTLGVVPILGRDFRPGEDSPGAPHPVILSYAAWQKRFGGRLGALGRTLTLNGDPATIVGVLPREFHFAPYAGAEFWGTLRASGTCEQYRGCHNLLAVARLKDGVSIETASASLQPIALQLRKQYPGDFGGTEGANLVPLRELIVGDVRPILLVLLSGAGLLLLIACVNVAALLLARSDTRQREIAVRGALGASSSRLFGQFATEGFVLAAAGGGLGVLFAGFAMRLLSALIPPDKLESMPYLRNLGLSPAAAALTFAISVVAAALFAIIPTARTSLAEMLEGLKEGARGHAGTSWRRFGSNLVVAEVAIATVLLAGAGLLGKSLYLLLHVDLGFRADHLLLLQVNWPPSNYTKDEQLIALGHRIVDRISSIHGVKSTALATTTPIDSAWGTTSVHVAGRPKEGEVNDVINRQVTAGYFSTLGVSLFEGRYFRDDENGSKPLVVIVNRAFVSKYLPGEDPIGKQIYYGGQPQSPMQIVGVVGDIKEGSLAAANKPALYVPFDQNPVGGPAVLVRTSQAETSLVPNLVAAIHKIDPLISVSGGTTMTNRIDQSPTAYLHRSSAWLVGSFAATALLLSVVGLYGVVAYSVSQRTREIGIRMALGAERISVYRLILKEAGALVALGVLFGLACSLPAAILMRSLLFGVRSWDPDTLISAAVLLAVSALAASYFPARRAASVNPVEALRTE